MYHFYLIPSISYGGIQDANNVKESVLATFWKKVKPGTVMKDRCGNFVTVFSAGHLSNDRYDGAGMFISLLQQGNLNLIIFPILNDGRN